MTDNKKVLMFPIKLILGFLVFTELFIWLGPNDYHIENSLVLLFYLLILNVALYWGYKFGLLKSRVSYFHLSDTWLHVLLIAGLIATFRYLIMVWNNHGISFTWENLIFGILNPGDAYLAESEHGYHGSFLDIIVLNPLRWAAIPLGVAFWKRLSNLYKGVLITTILLTLACSLGVGMRKGLFDLIIITFFVIISRNTSYITESTKKRKLVIIGVVSIILFLYYFVFSIASRKGDDLLLLSSGVVQNSTREFYDLLPSWLVYSLSSIDDYLCQGYYALSRALEMGIRPIVPFGDSWVAMYYSNKFFGYDPLPDTYLAALETYGIDPRVNWHTMYLWLANQYTFIGVPFVIFWVGYCLATTWRSAVSCKNDLVYPLFSYFLIMCFYMYANNQVFSDAAISFWIWFFSYHLLKNKI